MDRHGPEQNVIIQSSNVGRYGQSYITYPTALLPVRAGETWDISVSCRKWPESGGSIRTILEIVARGLLCVPGQDVKLLSIQEPLMRVLAVGLSRS